MGVTNSNKVLSADRIACDGSLRVTLALTAAPDILTNPTDIVLALDRSGSMAGTPLANVKLGARSFIDIIEKATDGSGQIGSGSRIGIVSFASTATADIVIDEVLNPDFVITSLPSPSRGTAEQLDAHSIKWTIPTLGVTAGESASLEFFVRHVSQEPGEKLVNASITYSDAEGNVVIFPKPKVMVDCDVVVQPDPCPVPVELKAEGCADSVVVDMGDVSLSSQGRILQLDVTVKNVCPGKRVALAAILTEVDENGMEHQRGMKVMTLPAHDQPSCRDVLVKCIKFVVPEDLDVSGGSPTSLCNPRNFKARFLANAIDTDYRCCEGVLTD